MWSAVYPGKVKIDVAKFQGICAWGGYDALLRSRLFINEFYHRTNATTLSAAGGSWCSSAWREISSECSVMYFE